jgi:uncharacterized protein YbdZ (MbtH family)
MGTRVAVQAGSARNPWSSISTSISTREENVKSGRTGESTNGIHGSRVVHYDTRHSLWMLHSEFEAGRRYLSSSERGSDCLDFVEGFEANDRRVGGE